MMESALDFLKEAIAQTHRNLSRCTITCLIGDIMYSMLLNEIAKTLFFNKNELAPAHYQWHNMNRTDDKMAQECLDSLQHQFIQAMKAANRLTSARVIMAKTSAIQRWTTAMTEMGR